MIEYKVKQQRLIVLIALYILRKNNKIHPAKRQVLNLVRMRNLMSIPDCEAVKRHDSDSDVIWEIDLCFRRKDLLCDGLVGDEEYGHWNITTQGLRHVEEISLKWLELEESEIRNSLLVRHSYITEDLCNWILKIARGEDLNLRTSSLQREVP